MNEQKNKQDIQSYFECIVCFELFNNQQRFPRILLCGHTFCQKCISIIIQRNTLFNCPICKTDLGMLRFGQTYKNYSLLKLMQINNINSQQTKTHTIIKPTFSQIVQQLDRTPKNITKLIIKRTRDDQKNPFDFDLIRRNRNSMRFYKLLVIFQKLEEFQFWVKFSAHGFQQCLAQSLYEIKSLKTVRVVNQYDQYGRMNQIVSLTGNQKVKFVVDIMEWSQLQQNLIQGKEKKQEKEE